MTPPRISIIIPCYNSEKLLPRCLDYVIAQDYDNKEVIIVDGASRDGSLETIKSYAANYPFIRWVSEKDRGVYDAMNKGVGMATGEWIYFLGTDDRFYDRDILSGIFSASHPASLSVIYGNVEFLYSKRIYDGPFDLRKILFVSNICHQAIFYRKSVFETVGLYDTGCTIYADRDFNIRCFLHKAVKLKYIDRIIAVYNEQDGLSAVDKTDLNFRTKQDRYIKDYNNKPVRLVVLKLRRLAAFLKTSLQQTRKG